MKFKIQAVNLANDSRQTFEYDNEDNVLSSADGTIFKYDNLDTKFQIANTFSKDKPLKKSKEIETLKIQLGLSCNYSCDYCSQRFVERPKETNKKDIAEFMAKLDNLSFDEQRGLRIEFWGGEPFVYWKTLKPLVEAMNLKFASWAVKPHYSVITNGSLLNDEICDWLFENNFSMAISHDGPAQYVRGPDPFDDPIKKETILKFYRKMKKHGRGFSFNAMLNVNNMSRKAVQDWFIDLTGDFSVTIGEGGIIDAYDADGIKNSLQTKADHFKFRQISFNDVLEHKGNIGFQMTLNKIDSFTQSVLMNKPASSVAQKCGMDSENTLAIDLRGDVITCQNVSTAEVAGNLEPHHAGNIINMEAVEIKTATHWRNRKHCSECPVVHICQGACMYLDGDNWEASCANSYSDAIALFALAFEKITGYIPVLIENTHLPDVRRDIFGTVLEHKEEGRKPFPIKVITEQKQIVVNDIPVYEQARME